MKHPARWIAVLVGLVVIGIFGVFISQVNGSSQSAVPRLVQQHGAAPSFKLTTLDGKTLDSNDLQGKTVVVNFFNSWCIPCQQEEPALKAFYDAHKNEADFAMVGIVHDDETPAARSYVRDQKIDWKIALDPKGEAALGFGTTGQPETYVIGPNGRAVCGALGPSNQAALESWLQIARDGQACAS